MRSLLLLLAVVSASMVSACGDNVNPGGGDDVIDAAAIDAGIVDAEVPDAVSCPAREAGQVGGPCTVNADCDSALGAADGYCWVGGVGAVVFAPEGYCMLDDGTGTVCTVDADCGAGNLCAADATNYRSCIPDCTCAGDACPTNQACIDTFNGYQLDKTGCLPGTAEAVDGDACDGFYECDEFTTCFNDLLEFPGGECQAYACTVGTNVGCNGGHCIAAEAPFTGTTCVDTCTSDTDCRGAEGYSCFDPDGGGAALRYCRHTHVGDACTTDDDCGTGVWACAVPTDGFVGGYCTVVGCTMPGNNGDCSPGSICHDPLAGDNYCANRCPNDEINMPSTCRTGYLCVDTDPAAPEGSNMHIQGGCVPAL